MKNAKCSVPVVVSLLAGVVLATTSLRAAPDEARVTRIIKDVKLLPVEAKAKAAVLDEMVSNGTGVRTGNESRSELTFPDLTIERLGANTIFSFNRGGRAVSLNSGSMLLRVPKDSGGAQMKTSAVTVGITGTTVILETRAGRNKLYVLEGGARLSLNKNKGESVFVRGGQLEDVPAGATKLSPPVNVDISDLMEKNPLITDFPPLPSRDLIMATASNPPPVRGQPVDGEPTRPGPVFVQSPIIPTILGLGPFFGRGGTNANTNTPGRNAKNAGNVPAKPKGKAVVNKGQPARGGNLAPNNVANQGNNPPAKKKKKPQANPNPVP